jgi:protein TonB
MRKEPKKDSLINNFIYPGGIQAMREFVKENLKYPQEALKAKLNALKG